MQKQQICLSGEIFGEVLVEKWITMNLLWLGVGDRSPASSLPHLLRGL